MCVCLCVAEVEERAVPSAHSGPACLSSAGGPSASHPAQPQPAPKTTQITGQSPFSLCLFIPSVLQSVHPLEAVFSLPGFMSKALK